MGKEEKTTSKGAQPGMAACLHARVPRGQSLAGMDERAGPGGTHGGCGGSPDAVVREGPTVTMAARLHARTLHGRSLARMGEHAGLEGHAVALAARRTRWGRGASVRWPGGASAPSNGR
jgi:hypothetical protein